MRKRWVMHVDMDAFFAAVEIHDNPKLKGKPVIVGGSSERGVVATCSYEARKYGVHSAMSSVLAHKLCPEAIYIKPRMERYQEVSKRIMAIFDEFSPCVEQLSVDEAFLDLSGMEKLTKDKDIASFGRKIKKRIKEETGLVASVGIAPNKFVAKMASDLEKPDGLVVIKHEEVETKIANFSIKRIFGLGPKSAEILLNMGIRTIGQLRSLGQNDLKRIFGKNSYKMAELAYGIDEREVENERERKSIGKETTFEKDVFTEKERNKALLALVEQVGFRMRKKGVVAHTITLKVKYSNFKTITRSHTVETPINLDEDIYQEIMRMANNVNWKEPVRLLGVSASKLLVGEMPTLLLFEDDESKKQRNAVMDSLKKRFGEDIIKRGRV
jgi:DNA polymerase-4